MGMDKEQLIAIISDKIKLIRVEQGYTQDRMAVIIGVSKKTLVQIEKGRILAGWTTVVAVIALFPGSSVLKAACGDSPLETALTIAHQRYEWEASRQEEWYWKPLEEKGSVVMEQHAVSGHYRISDYNTGRRFTSVDRTEAEMTLDRWT